MAATVAWTMPAPSVAVPVVHQPSRKLIAAGWDIPTPARFRDEVAAFEQWGVFDGTVIVPTRRVDGRDVDCRKAFTREHWGHLAWLARQGGLQGLHFHVEPYHCPPPSQFRYSAQPQRDRHTYAEYREKARTLGPRLLAPEHRDNFLGWLHISFPVYLDAAANPPDAKYHLPPWTDRRPPGSRPMSSPA
jgi:hypothetical protein